VPYFSPLHPGRIVTTFIGIDAVIGALSGNGASYASNSSLPESKRNLGKSLLKAALLLQLGSMAGFVAIAVRYQYRCRKAGVLNHNLRTVLTVLYTSCAIISTRTIYRTVEYFAVSSINAEAGFKTISPVIKHEAFFWVFEASLMLCNSVLMNTFHPSRFLPRNNKIYLAEDGVTEIEGPGYDDKRPFIVTLFDPFDIVGLIIRRDRKNRYWEAGNTTAPMPEQPQDEKSDASKGPSTVA
jgi:RTA1 like protein